MRIVFNIYNANRWLPEPVWIFQLVRRVDKLMKDEPNKNWLKIREWCRPMNQITPGLFFNITDADLGAIEKAIDLNGDGSDDLRLELSWVDQGYARVTFYVEGIEL